MDARVYTPLFTYKINARMEVQWPVHFLAKVFVGRSRLFLSQSENGSRFPSSFPSSSRSFA